MWSVIKHNSNAIVTITTRCKVTALDFYDKEARTLMQDESLEVWDNGKLVSRCQFDILPGLKAGVSHGKSDENHRE